MSENSLGAAAGSLAQTMNTWAEPINLTSLNLRNCSVPEKEWTDLFHTFVRYRNLQELNLGENNFGTGSQGLIDAVRSWGNHSCLERLYINDPLMAAGRWTELLYSLQACSNLTVLDIPQDVLDQAGFHVQVILTSQTKTDPLKYTIAVKRKPTDIPLHQPTPKILREEVKVKVEGKRELPPAHIQPPGSSTEPLQTPQSVTEQQMEQPGFLSLATLATGMLETN